MPNKDYFCVENAYSGENEIALNSSNDISLPVIYYSLDETSDPYTYDYKYIINPYLHVFNTEIASDGYTNNNVIVFRYTWPCCIPFPLWQRTSYVHQDHPVSRVLTSFVPPIHNQGVSYAPIRGLAPWKKFLPTTGSFFVF